MIEPLISVIIPSFNETENIRAGALEQIFQYLSKQKYSWEAIVSDDGSTAQEAVLLAKDFCSKHKNFIFVENEHGGKPFALWGGIQQATGKIILLTDMDQSTPITEAEKLLPFYEDGFDVVIGSRGVGRKNFSLFRLLASFVFRTFRRLFLVGDIVDTQCGFKSMKRSVALEVFPRLSVIRKGRPKDKNWHVGAWDTEFLFIAENNGFKIKEVPVNWANKDLSMETKKSTNKGKFFKESIEMVQEVISVRLNNLRGYYRT